MSSVRTVKAIPGTFTMSVREHLNLKFNMTPLLDSTDSEVVNACTTTLEDGTEGTSVTLTDDPSFAGSQVIQPIDGPTELVAGRTFGLSILFTASPSSNQWVVELDIVAIP